VSLEIHSEEMDAFGILLPAHVTHRCRSSLSSGALELNLCLDWESFPNQCRHIYFAQWSTYRSAWTMLCFLSLITQLVKRVKIFTAVKIKVEVLCCDAV